MSNLAKGTPISTSPIARAKDIIRDLEDDMKDYDPYLAAYNLSYITHIRDTLQDLINSLQRQ